MIGPSRFEPLLKIEPPGCPVPGRWICGVFVLPLLGVSGFWSW